jgi:hypothetical protein
MKKRRWMILSLLILALIGTGCYFLFAGEKENPNLAPLKEEVKKLPQQNLTPQQLLATGQKIREQAKNFSEKDRNKLRQAGREVFMQIMNQRMDQYFNAPPEEKKKVLDRQIREMEPFIKQMQAMRAQAQQRRNAANANATNNGQGNNSGQTAQAGPSGRGDRRRSPPANQEERQQRRKAMLDRIPSKDRVRFIEYFTAIRDRRKELGMPDIPFGRR